MIQKEKEPVIATIWKWWNSLIEFMFWGLFCIIIRDFVIVGNRKQLKKQRSLMILLKTLIKDLKILSDKSRKEQKTLVVEVSKYKVFKASIKV